MKDIVISVPDKEYAFFLKLVQQLNFVTIKETPDPIPTKQQFLNGLKDAVNEVKEVKARKKTGQTLKAFLDDL